MLFEVHKALVEGRGRCKSESAPRLKKTLQTHCLSNGYQDALYNLAVLVEGVTRLVCEVQGVDVRALSRGGVGGTLGDIVDGLGKGRREGSGCV